MAEFIRTRSGIRMPPSKKSFLEGRIRRHMRQIGFATMSDYCKWLLEEGGLDQEESALLDAVTTNKTEFFRERHHFDFLIMWSCRIFEHHQAAPASPADLECRLFQWR